MNNQPSINLPNLVPPEFPDPNFKNTTPSNLGEKGPQADSCGLVAEDDTSGGGVVALVRCGVGHLGAFFTLGVLFGVAFSLPNACSQRVHRPLLACEQAKGKCMDVTKQSCTNGKFVRGMCPGDYNQQCCVPNTAPAGSSSASSKCVQQGGKCMDVRNSAICVLDMRA